MRVCVVGQGYVGLPLAIRAVEAGHDVVGVDVDAFRVKLLNRGESCTRAVTSAALDSALASGRLTISTDEQALRGFDIALITVPTPLRDGVPDLSSVEQAAAMVGAYLRSGATVVLESTSYPGTTEHVVLPQLEKWSRLSALDFHLGFSPDRIDRGNGTWDVYNTPKLVAGLHECCLEAVDGFYRSIVKHTVPAGSLVTAELAKILQDTFRHVDVALTVNPGTGRVRQGDAVLHGSARGHLAASAGRRLPRDPTSYDSHLLRPATPPALRDGYLHEDRLGHATAGRITDHIAHIGQVSREEHGARRSRRMT